MKLAIHRNAKMLDAGTAYFVSNKGYGTVLGQVKAEMEEYGRVYKYTEFSAEQLPVSYRGCELILDFSTLWRNRYILCKLEDSGKIGDTTDGEIRRYSAVFIEGDSSGILRNFCYTIIIISLIAIGLTLSFSVHGIFAFIGIAAAIFTIYHFANSSKTAVITVKKLKDKLEK